MPMFINQSRPRVRANPLGPVTLNQAHANLETVDGFVLPEHFSDGQHNAQEIPWILGHIGTSTTGYMFDSAYGGGTIARPSTGVTTLDAASGVVEMVTSPLTGSSIAAASVLANVSDSDVATYPHQVDVEMVSGTSIKATVRRMYSTLGVPGGLWELTSPAIDIAVHAQKQPVDASLLVSSIEKSRRDFLTEAATDWNALVENQGIIRATLMHEHDSAGTHSADRIAKASGWFRPASGPVFEVSLGHNIKGVSRISEGVIEVEHDFTFSSTNLPACFPQAQPASADELVIVNGYCTTTTKFRFYVYVYSSSEEKWSRGDRSFFAAMFGRLA